MEGGTCGPGGGGLVCFPSLCPHAGGLGPAERDESAHGCYLCKALTCMTTLGAGTILIMTIPILQMKIQDTE